MNPEDLILQVVAELVDHNTFESNFNKVPLEMLVRFVKCPQDGLKTLVSGRLIDAGQRDHRKHIEAAYNIALFEVGKSIEALIAVEPTWIEVLDTTIKDQHPSVRLEYRQMFAYLRRMPVWRKADATN